MARVENRQTGARVRCLASDPRRAHGLAPVLVLADEPAQWPETTGQRMVAALRTAAGKQPHSRFVALGTRPSDGQHWFGKLLNGGAQYSQCHAADPKAPKFQRRTWARANPSLPAMPNLLDAIRTEAGEAQRDPDLLTSFEALRLNLGTSDVSISVLLDAALWERSEGLADSEGGMTWGIDLGTSAAQSAIAALWPATGRLQCVAAFPEQPGLAERGLADGVGSLYRRCADRGEPLTLGGLATDIPKLLRAGLDAFGKPDLLRSG